MPENSSPRFLLVDDDLSWREELGGLLRDHGYRVETAASKEEAMERFERGEEFDLAILDIRLDERDEANIDGLHLGFWISRHTEGLRRQYLTLAPGKVLEYTYKEQEYQAWSAAGQPAEPDPALYPLAAAEGPEMGLTLPEMLALIGQRAGECCLAGAQIAALERRLLVALGAATTVEEINQVLGSMADPRAG